MVEKKDDNRRNKAFPRISGKNLKRPRAAVSDPRCAGEPIGPPSRNGRRNIAGIFASGNYRRMERFQGMAAALQKNGVACQDGCIKWRVSNKARGVRSARSIDRVWKRLRQTQSLLKME